MLSRGMIINVSALFIGASNSLKYHSIFTSIRFILISLFMFIFLFVISVGIVVQMRSHSFGYDPINYEALVNETSDFERNRMASRTRLLLLARWVGIEGVMAVSSYPELGWDLWKTAWNEKYSNYGTSFYDLQIISSQYLRADWSKHHFISLPGVLAFFYYPGSLIFLFFSMFLLAAVAAGIEISIYKLGESNIILCCLLAQVVAYRYVHFGYVPGRSYLLFGSIYLNLFLIYFSNKFLLYWQRKNPIPDQAGNVHRPRLP